MKTDYSLVAFSPKASTFAAGRSPDFLMWPSRIHRIQWHVGHRSAQIAADEITVAGTVPDFHRIPF